MNLTWYFELEHTHESRSFENDPLYNVLLLIDIFYSM